LSILNIDYNGTVSQERDGISIISLEQYNNGIESHERYDNLLQF